MAILLNVPFDHSVQGGRAPHNVESPAQTKWETLQLSRVLDQTLDRIEARLSALDAKATVAKR